MLDVPLFRSKLVGACNVTSCSTIRRGAEFYTSCWDHQCIHSSKWKIILNRFASPAPPPKKKKLPKQLKTNYCMSPICHPSARSLDINDWSSIIDSLMTFCEAHSTSTSSRSRSSRSSAASAASAASAPLWAREALYHVPLGPNGKRGNAWRCTHLLSMNLCVTMLLYMITIYYNTVRWCLAASLFARLWRAQQRKRTMEESPELRTELRSLLKLLRLLKHGNRWQYLHLLWICFAVLGELVHAFSFRLVGLFLEF